MLGGAFDPVHLGHITLAREICRLRQLRGVILVPASNHPVKKNQAFASFDDRVKMLQLATAPYDIFIISRIEHERKLSGYTLDTVRALKDEYPGVEFSFIIGADNIQQMIHWHKPDEIAREVRIVAGSRPDFVGVKLPEALADAVEFVETQLVEASSTGCREAIRRGEPEELLDRMVGEKVREYIVEKGLYR